MLIAVGAGVVLAHAACASLAFWQSCSAGSSALEAGGAAALSPIVFGLVGVPVGFVLGVLTMPLIAYCLEDRPLKEGLAIVYIPALLTAVITGPILSMSSALATLVPVVVGAMCVRLFVPRATAPLA